MVYILIIENIIIMGGDRFIGVAAKPKGTANNKCAKK